MTENRRKFIYALFLSIIVLFIALIAAEVYTKHLLLKKKQKIDWFTVSMSEEEQVYSVAYSYFDWVKDYMMDRRLHANAGTIYEPFSLWRYSPFKSKYRNIEILEYGILMIY